MHCLHTGMRSTHSYTADHERLADRYGNAGVPVLATPHLVSLLETECLACVAGALDDGHSTVGTRIDVRHLAATPAGVRFNLTAELTELETAAFLANAAAKRASRTV